MVKILVVDDEKTTVDIIKCNLESEGFGVYLCQDGEEAVNLAYNENPDLILIDLMMPNLDGFQICKKIRDFSNCPIIILTAEGEEKKKVMGFENGADDYVTKPFGHKELLARIKAHIRRYHFMGGVKKQSSHNFFGLEVIPETYEVRRNGNNVELTQREFDLLMFLLKNAGKVYSREQLLQLVWGFDYYGDVRTVDVTVHRLREKIESDPSKAELILTKRGFGYYFKRN